MPRRLWHLLHEPRIVTAAQGVVWLAWLATGLAALIAPPMTIAHEIGPSLTILWSGLLLLGGILGLAGCLPGWWWVERAGILSATSGALVYLTVVLSLHASATGSRLVQAGFILLAIGSLGVRWLRIRGAQSDPMRGIAR